MSRPQKGPAACALSPPRLRCAIYTRKSSEEGLEQDFNSLDAQREACEAYVRSQAGEGWGSLPAAYDDGGFSGGNVDRPGLTRLLADIDARRIDVVVVYKVDRLTRSLTDFSKIVERFDAAGVSFVSVTQAFNTTTSMGRLTLNVLLSFAQFEREVTGERIRDKIAASKKKGMWMGGNVPLGYEPEGRTLRVNEAEALQVRRIFACYLELGSVQALKAELAAEGVLPKQRTSASGRKLGGAAFSRGALFHLLSNRLYLGEIPHKGESYLGQHPATVDTGLFEAVQQRLARNAGPTRRARAGLKPIALKAPLAGRVFDDGGNRMTHVAARKGRGRVYRYYVSTAVQQGRNAEAGSLARIPAPALEDVVRDRLGRLDANIDDIRRIEVGRRRLVIELDMQALPGDPPILPTTDQLSHHAGMAKLTIAASMRWRGGAKVAVGPGGEAAVDAPRVDLPLLRALIKAEAWKAELLRGGVTMDGLAGREGVHRGYAQRVLRLAWLSPTLKRSILEGTAPAGLMLRRLLQEDIPLAWVDQARAFAGA
ncbi:MAG: recombinase family protein [Caulobacterales bacterium]